MKILILTCIGLLSGLSSYSQWIQTNPPSGGTSIPVLGIINNNVFSGTSDGQVYVSTSNGNVWNHIGSNIGTVSSLFTHKNKLYTSTGSIFVCDSNGGNWGTLALLGGYAANSAVFVNDTDMILDVVDGMVSWGSLIHLSIHSPSNFTVSMNGIHIPNNIKYLAVNDNKTYVYNGDIGSGVYRSLDQGLNWTGCNTGLSNFNMLSLYCYDSVVYIGTDGGSLFVSYNNGGYWLNIGNGLPNRIFSVVRKGNCLFVGAAQGLSHQGVYLSTDQGGNWSAVNTGLTNLDVRSLATNNSYLFAGTNGSGVWRRPLSELTGIENLKEMGCNIFPNPTTDYINFTKEVNDVKLFNSAGQLVWSNKKTNKVDMLDFGSGVYFLNYNNIIHQKIVKL